MKKLLSVLGYMSMLTVNTFNAACSEAPHTQSLPASSQRAVLQKFTESAYIETLKSASVAEDIDVCFARAIYDTEYTGSALYVSETGAVGIMELMPREGSYTTQNYENYMNARITKGRVYQGQSAEDWASAYQRDLAVLAKEYASRKDYEGLFAQDKRFDPEWNIESGVHELATNYHHFEAKGHSPQETRELAAAAYNAGIPAVEKGTDHVPQNGQTEGYVEYVMQQFTARTNAGTCLSLY